ncbi:MAG TPA: hypothetical protein VIM02_03990 [Rhizomicrobium sp.]
MVFTLIMKASVLARGTSILLRGRFAPEGRVATAVPRASKESLGMDFSRALKIRPGGFDRATGAARQLLPRGGNFCRLRWREFTWRKRKTARAMVSRAVEMKASPRFS